MVVGGGTPNETVGESCGHSDGIAKRTLMTLHQPALKAAAFDWYKTLKVVATYMPGEVKWRSQKKS